ncbi:MAG TPA: molybdopterin-dependent oxidoreductase [Terriglobia bacterium]|nr:molybdopterin-dependent oxidoreductase [Terriglobia bacterium]
MERRDFLKISAATGATAALSSCSHPEHQLIRFIPEEELQPGVAVFKPSVCTMCPAGCGLTVRVMEGDAEVVRHGKLGLIKMGLAKKLEGNADHPVNRGKLCARGQAGLQVTYHPDRLRTPLRRTGPRGAGEFEPITWDEALGALVLQLDALRSANMATSLAFLTRSLHGQRSELIDRFMTGYGSEITVTFDPFDDAVLRRANLLSFGQGALPTFDLARADYILSFGADFLGTWNSPVAQAIGYGEMRQGRPGARGRVVQVEPRLSQTGANADQWIPIRPGTEGILALGVAHLLLASGGKHLSIASPAQNLITGWSEGLPDYTPEKVEKRTGVPAKTIARTANEFAQSGAAVAVIGGAPLAHTNGLFSALAVNALNSLVAAHGSVDSPGIISFAPRSPFNPVSASLPGVNKSAGYFQVAALAAQIRTEQPHPVKALLLYEANPVFAMPPGFGVREALERIPFIASFGSFIDETSVLADLILPDHSPLESWLDVVPESGFHGTVASLAPPALRPLHYTRAIPDALIEVAHRLGGKLSDALPWGSFEEMLRAAFIQLTGAAAADDSWKKALQQGGWWSTDLKQPTTTPAGTKAGTPAGGSPHAPFTSSEPEFDGNEGEFPFHFLPYPSQAFFDGSTAHLPWMQELPDVLSSAMWSVWVEINPQTAAQFSIQQGDLVEVASRHGRLRAPALLYPAIAPDVVAMPVGQGHEHFTRYASGRGANAVSILAPTMEESVGALAWAATRVTVRRVGDGKKQLTLFGGGMREESREKR